MKIVRIIPTFGTVLIVLTLGGLSMAAEKAKSTPDKKQGTIHTVTASMDYPTNGGVGIQAERRPGEFTIPKGAKGTKLKYNFFNPKSGNTLTKINGSNIYSVTEKRYMHELDKNPDFELPAGQYRFVVGGDPGAVGTLSYTTVPVVPGTDVKPPPGGTQPDPHTRKPQPPTDTSNAGTQRGPLHPGGEGKRKATLHLTSTTTDASGTRTWSGDIPVTLVISEGKMRLEYPKDMQGVIERWDGTLTRQGEAVTVKGTTERNYSFHGGQSTTEWKGTFAGKLEGAVLKGTVAAHAELKSFGKVDATADLKGEWSIQEFVKQQRGPD